MSLYAAWKVKSKIILTRSQHKCLRMKTQRIYKRKPLKPIREFNKAAEYKVSTQKSNLYLCIRNVQLYAKQ